MADSIRIGTRKSNLALWQTRHVIDRLKAACPDVTIEEVLFTTQGDKILDKPLAEIGDKGLFTQELEEQLLDGRIDMAVHSLKDLPTVLPDGLGVGAVLERATPWDAFVSNRFDSLDALPDGAVVGTSSLRRAAQLKRLRPDVVQKDIRGNVETRLSKLDSGEYDAIILAAAGLTRLGLEDRITARLQAPWYYAVGQGAIAVETAVANQDVAPFLNILGHESTHSRVTAERAFLRTLEGGCQVPIGVRSTIDGETLTLEGMVSDLEGTTVLTGQSSSHCDDAEVLGRKLADDLLEKGAREILNSIQ